MDLGDHCQLGEVQAPAIHLCPVSGDADRHIPREGAPITSLSGSFSGGGDFLSLAFVAPSTHVAAIVRPHGFAGGLSSSGLLLHVSVAMGSQRPLVPMVDNLAIQIPLSQVCL